MTNRIYTYSLIRAYYDVGKDYIDSFWPFVVCLLSKDEEMAIDTIQEKLLNEFSLEVPIHSLNVILTRAKRSNYVSQKHRHICLTDHGRNFQQSLELPRDVERRINKFIDECKQYLEETNKLEISTEDLQERIDLFLRTNTELVEVYCSQQVTDSSVRDQNNDMNEIDRAILDFFIHVENQKPESYKTLRDMITGSIISIVLSSDDISQITKKTNNLTVYFDTNIVLSILGLDIDEFCKPAQELYRILHNDRAIQLKIFDFTLIEVIRVLQNYIPNMNNYFPSIKVRSLYSKIKSMGWTRADLREYIVNIEEYLADKKIKIEPTRIDIDDFSLENPDYRVTISQYKPNQGRWAQSHDLAVIKMGKERRPSLIHKLEKSRAVFITSDKKLAKYNYVEWGHQSLGTISEVFPDSVMTNILWLKNPQTLENISIETIISMHSRAGIIDNNIWNSFISIVKQLREDENINDKDIALLLYDSRIQDDLVNAKHNELSEDWVHAKIARAKNELDEEKAKFEAIELEADEEIQEIANRVFDSIQQVKTKIQNRAHRAANIVVNVVSVILLGVFIYVTWKLFPTVLERWDVIEPLVLVINLLLTLAVILFGVKLKLSNFRNSMVSFLFEKINLFLINLSNIEDIAKSIS